MDARGAGWCGHVAVCSAGECARVVRAANEVTKPTITKLSVSALAAYNIVKCCRSCLMSSLLSAKSGNASRDFWHSSKESWKSPSL